MPNNQSQAPELPSTGALSEGQMLVKITDQMEQSRKAIGDFSQGVVDIYEVKKHLADLNKLISKFHFQY